MGWMDGWLSLYDGLLRAPTVLIREYHSGPGNVTRTRVRTGQLWEWVMWCGFGRWEWMLICPLMFLSLFFNWFVYGLWWQWSHWYLIYLRVLCDLRLHHWHAIRSHWLHLNLVPTRLCVLSKCFWVSSRSHCSHLNSLEKACVAKVPNNELFQYINWKKPPR